MNANQNQTVTGIHQDETDRVHRNIHNGRAVSGYIDLAEFRKSIPSALFGLVLGFRVPELFLESIRKKRAKQLNDQLPQALSLISNGLRAGFSFSQAMAVVGREMEAPIADEFAKVLRDNSYGKNMDEALLELGKRTDDEDLDIFITTLLIHLQVGGDLSEILDTISEDDPGTRQTERRHPHDDCPKSDVGSRYRYPSGCDCSRVMFVLNPSYIGSLFSDTR